jgi:hypothetical protein
MKTNEYGQFVFLYGSSTVGEATITAKATLPEGEQVTAPDVKITWVEFGLAISASPQRPLVSSIMLLDDRVQS